MLVKMMPAMLTETLAVYSAADDGGGGDGTRGTSSSL